MRKVLLIMTLLFVVSSCARGNGDMRIDRPNRPEPTGSIRNSEGYYYYRQQPYDAAPPYGGYYNAPPASRFYQNPYAFPPPNQGYYYDGDRYYTPPAYGNPDVLRNGGGSSFDTIR